MHPEMMRSRRPDPSIPPRSTLPELNEAPRKPQKQINVGDLRDRIQKNRARWLDNAKKSTLSQRPKARLMSGASGIAAITGLATVITVAAGLFYNEASKATRLAQIPAAPEATKAPEAPAVAKATEEPEIIKAEDSLVDPAPKSKKTIVSRITQEQ